MSSPQPTLQTLKGVRDVLPHDKLQRDWVQRRITEAFARFGFSPLETPTLEYKETLMGKYGEEADKLVYQFVDNGGREVALRYDQTVPTARVMAQYQHLLPLPFRRYQIQNVFRADKPQKGRYREFTQCDCDIFGSTEVLADAEILAVLYAAYASIGFSAQQLQLCINDRSLLVETLEPFATSEVTVSSMIQSIDKLDKLSAHDVQAELVRKGLDSDAATAVLERIQTVQPSARLEEIRELAMALGVPAEVLQFTPTLARGLDYYTGMIVEVTAPGLGGGSLGGGGRYDHLIEQLSGVSLPAVGFGLGFDRTVEAAVELGLVPESLEASQILVTVFDADHQTQACRVAARLRSEGLAAELYPAAAKLAKQFKYADKNRMRWVLVIGPDEASAGRVLLKNLQSGTQESLSLDEAVSRLRA